MAKLTLQILGQTTGGANSIDAVIQKIKNDLQAIEKAPIKITVDSSGVKALEQTASSINNVGTAAQGLSSASAQITKFTDTVVQGATAVRKQVTEMRTAQGEYVKTVMEAGEEESKVTKQTIINYEEKQKAAEKAEKAFLALKRQSAQIERELEGERLEESVRKAEEEKKAKEKAEKEFQALKRESARVSREAEEESAQWWARRAADQQKAADNLVRLEGEYARFIRQVQNLKAQYPEGTFDNIEHQAKEAQIALQGLDVTTKEGQQAFETYKRTLLNLKTGFQTAQQETKKLDKVTESLWMNLQKFARWWLVGGVVTSITRSLREAIKTMKEVDQELTNIAKVSDLSASELKRIGDSAYETASKYGVAADEYLKAVYTFQKAGLGGSSEGLAELATKTMLVGDTTAEVATKFLIAANAAWKYGGDVEALSAVVDKADYLNNNFAVSLEDIAAAFPIVASTASQAGLTVEQTMAAITTIVSQTVQSGNRAGTALRALIMNLAGETGELDEGFAVTEESIKSLNGILVQFAPDALAAAQAAGKIVDPMEAIAALAKAAQAGILDSAELFNIVSDIGGKLRANQLNALIEGQETYNKALAGTADAAGTADKEISTMLESWNAKTQILQNSWTQLISHLLDTGVLKTLIEGLTAVFKFLDTGFGRAAIQILAVSTGLTLLTRKVPQLLATLTGSKGLVAGIKAVAEAIETVRVGAGTAGEALKVLFAENPLIVFAAVAAAIYGIVKALDALIVTSNEHLDKAKKYSEAAEEAASKAESLQQKLDENNRLLAEANELGKSDAYITRLQNENTLLEEQIRLEKNRNAENKEKADDAARKAFDKQSYLYEHYEENEIGELVYVPEFYNITDYIKKLIELEIAGENVDKELSKVVQKASELADEFDENRDGSQEYIDALIEVIKAYNDLYEAEHGATEGETDFGDGVEPVTEKVEEQVDKLKELNDQIDSVQSALKTLQDAQDEYNETGALSVDTLQKLIALDPEYLAALVNEAGEIDLNSDAVSNLIDGKNVLLNRLAAEAIAAYAVSEAQRLAAQETDSAASSAESSGSAVESAATQYITFGNSAIYAAKGVTALQMALRQLAGSYGLTGNDLRDYLRNVQNFADNVYDIFGNVDLGLGGWSGSSGGGGGSGGGSGSSEDTYLKSLQAIVSLEKQRLSLLEASGASVEEQVAQIQVIQAAIHDEAEYLRSIGAEEEDILKLQTEWWNLQNKITDLLDKQAEETLKQLEEAYKEAEEALLKWLETEQEDATAALREQLEILKAQQEVTSNARMEEEKRLAVEKARLALENAMNERTVRQYNAATGRWEYVANAQTVASAQEGLASAEQALADFLLEQEISALEDQISSIEDSFKELEDAIESLSDTIDLETQSFADAILEIMRRNSEEWLTASPDRQQELAYMNSILGASQGWYRDSDGVWHYPDGERVYDRGGILRGVGGFKGTWENEMVLPPSATAALLTAENTGAFDSLLDHLGIVTAAARSLSGFGGGSIGNRIGSQHNGNVYQFGKITLTEGQARGMTVYDLARMAGNLSLCANAV